MTVSRQMRCASALLAVGLLWTAGSLAQTPTASVDSEECFETGNRYYYGTEGNPLDFRQAAEWFRKAAEAGHTNAQAVLGYMQVTGSGIPFAVEEGLGRIRHAAAQSNAVAQFYLGYFYETGRGVEPDRFEAMDWYVRAAEQGDSKARRNLNDLRKESDALRQGTATNEWSSSFLSDLEELAAQGDADAQLRLGVRYKGFCGMAPDLEKARIWLEKAVAQTNFRAHYELACLYLYAPEVVPEKAFYHASVAAEGGFAAAQCELGSYFRVGMGTPRDRAAALHWLTLAAQNGESRAARELERLIQGKAVSTANSTSRWTHVDDYKAPTVQLKIHDLEDREREVKFVGLDPVTQTVKIDYLFGATNVLPLVGFDAASQELIEEPLRAKVFGEKMLFKMDAQKYTTRDLEGVGLPSGESGPVEHLYEGASYTLEIRNRGTIDLENLTVEMRIYTAESEIWTYPPRTASSNCFTTVTNKIARLAPGESWQIDPQEEITHSVRLIGADYYTDGSPSHELSQLLGAQVRVYRTAPGKVTVFAEACYPLKLSEQIDWKGLPPRPKARR